MPADSLWAFVMACNVYLAMFHRYRTDNLRPLEWKYFLFCYGLPFVPALVLLFIGTKSHGRIYGPALVSPVPLSLTSTRSNLPLYLAMVLDIITVGLSANRPILRTSMAYYRFDLLYIRACRHFHLQATQAAPQIH